MIITRKYKNVASTSIETKSYTVPTGKTLQIRHACGSAGASPDTVVYIIVDAGGPSEDVVMATHGDMNMKYDPPIEVAAGLVVDIKLVNNQSSADYIGAMWGATLN